VWFFDFLRTDLKSLTPGQRLGMRADLWAFVDPELVEREEDERWPEGMPDVAVLEALQRDAIEGIERLRKGDWWTLDKGISYGIAWVGDRFIRGSRRGTFKDLFRATAMEEIRAHGSRLRSCPRCSGIFLRIGKRKFCSAICANRAHWDAFKERRTPRDHQREYARRVRRALSPNVKISARKRKRKKS
jgi:hypothetical protein